MGVPDTGGAVTAAADGVVVVVRLVCGARCRGRDWSGDILAGLLLKHVCHVARDGKVVPIPLHRIGLFEQLEMVVMPLVMGLAWLNIVPRENSLLMMICTLSVLQHRLHPRCLIVCYSLYNTRWSILFSGQRLF